MYFTNEKLPSRSKSNTGNNRINEKIEINAKSHLFIESYNSLEILQLLNFSPEWSLGSRRDANMLGAIWQMLNLASVLA